MHFIDEQLPTIYNSAEEFRDLIWYIKDNNALKNVHNLWKWFYKWCQSDPQKGKTKAMGICTPVALTIALGGKVSSTDAAYQMWLIENYINRESKQKEIEKFEAEWYQKPKWRAKRDTKNIIKGG